MAPKTSLSRPFTLADLSGRRTLITGAGRGIGLAIARRVWPILLDPLARRHRALRRPLTTVCSAPNKLERWTIEERHPVGSLGNRATLLEEPGVD